MEGAADEAVETVEASGNPSRELTVPSNMSTDTSLFISGRGG